MMIKIWTNKVDNDLYYTTGKARNQSILRSLKLTSGAALSDRWPEVVIDITSDYKPADSFLSGPMLIVSRELADLIYEFATDKEVEYLPVEVVYKGNSQGEYGFLNILNICDALDRSNSQFTEIDGIIDSIDLVKIDELTTEGKTIFQLDAIEWIVCVDEGLAEEIEKAAFTGIVFKSESEWQPF